ncbi:MAG TPA: RidA family protein [Pseudomonadota bacterium]|nr:RidA family protein [Pseudomonadota bacterium]
MNPSEPAQPARVNQRLAALGIELPSLLPPVAPGYTPAFVPYRRSGTQIHVSGRLAKRDGQVLCGKVGADISLAEAREAARSVAIEFLSVLREAAGELDKVRVVKLFAMVNGAPDFCEPHRVADAASELLLAVFGPSGAHARSAISVTQCPFAACLELELLAEIDV